MSELSLTTKNIYINIFEEPFNKNLQPAKIRIKWTNKKKERKINKTESTNHSIVIMMLGKLFPFPLRHFAYKKGTIGYNNILNKTL